MIFYFPDTRLTPLLFYSIEQIESRGESTIQREQEIASVKKALNFLDFMILAIKGKEPKRELLLKLMELDRACEDNV